jgi:hypothetical protein
MRHVTHCMLHLLLMSCSLLALLLIPHLLHCLPLL